MANVYLPYGYIDQFGNADLNNPVIQPLLCQLKAPRTARILTLANGRALNVSATPAPIFPFDQQLEILIHGTTSGEGPLINAMLDTITGKYGQQDALRVKIPNSARVLTAQAVLDYAEIVEDGQMDDTGVVNWSIVRLYFKQLELFHD